MSATTSSSDKDGERTVDILGLASLFVSPRVSTKELAQMCRRLSMSLGAGVDIRTVCQREVERASPYALRTRMVKIRDAVNEGEGISDALAATGDFFPLFRETVKVGDESGYLSEVFGRLAEHYEEKIRLRRMFLAAIAWPMVQLILALFVIGLLIWLMGALGLSVDLLGWGMVGTPGLVKYLLILASIGLVLFLVGRAASRGLVWTRPIQRAVLRIPAFGRPLQTIAVARLAWTLHMTLESGMPVRRAMRLGLRSTGNARYTDREGHVDQSIAVGNSIYDSLSDTGAFDHEFLDAVRVGEDSGRLVESMGHLSKQYNERASAALKTLTMLAGVGVWVLVAALIIMMIFRLFFFYFNTLTEFQ